MNNAFFQTETHEWVKFVSDDECFIGITDWGIELLGEILSIELPEEGIAVEAGVVFADIEGVNLATEVYSPVSGIIAEVNEDILSNLDKICDSPYDAWLIKVRNITEKAELMTESEYKNFIDNI